MRSAGSLRFVCGGRAIVGHPRQQLLIEVNLTRSILGQDAPEEPSLQPTALHTILSRSSSRLARQVVAAAPHSGDGSRAPHDRSRAGGSTDTPAHDACLRSRRHVPGRGRRRQSGTIPRHVWISKLGSPCRRIVAQLSRSAGTRRVPLHRLGARHHQSPPRMPTSRSSRSAPGPLPWKVKLRPLHDKVPDVGPLPQHMRTRTRRRPARSAH